MTVSPPTLSDLKAQLNNTSSANDTELTHYLNAAQAIVEGRIGLYATTPVSEVINARGNGLNLSYRPIQSVTSLTPLLNTWPSFTSTDVQFDPRAGTVWRKDLGTLAGAWTVAYTAGWGGLIQENWFLAHLIIAQNLWETQRGDAAIPGQAVDEFSPSWGGGDPIPPRALELLGDGIFFGGIA